jgi:flagellar biosynthesis protein FlhB
MAENDSGEKTEEPTGKRVEDAREKGQIPKSPEFVTAAFLLGFLHGVLLRGAAAVAFPARDHGRHARPAGDAAYDGVGLVTHLQVAQFPHHRRHRLGHGGALPSWPSPSRRCRRAACSRRRPSSPSSSDSARSRTQRSTSGKQPYVELLKSLLKMAIVSYAVYATLQDAWPDIQALSLSPSPMALAELVTSTASRSSSNAGFMFVVLALADYGWSSAGRRTKTSR